MPSTIDVWGYILYLFIADVLGAVGGRFLHGSQTHDLEQVVLHDVPDNPKLVKVPSTTHRPERLLECHDNVGNVVPVPYRLEHSVCKPLISQNKNRVRGERVREGRKERGEGGEMEFIHGAKRKVFSTCLQ